jgi:hypothetical protein
MNHPYEPYIWNTMNTGSLSIDLRLPVLTYPVKPGEDCPEKIPSGLISKLMMTVYRNTNGVTPPIGREVVPLSNQRFFPLQACPV